MIILTRICALPLDNKYREEQMLSYQAPTVQVMQTQGHVTYPANLDAISNKIMALECFSAHCTHQTALLMQ